jgi:hypothetical protein
MESIKIPFERDQEEENGEQKINYGAFMGDCFNIHLLPLRSARAIRL